MLLPLTTLSMGSALICQTSSLTQAPDMHRCSRPYASICHITMGITVQKCTNLVRLITHREASADPCTAFLTLMPTIFY